MKPKKMKKYVKEVQKRIAKSEFELFDTWQYIEDSGYVDFVFLGEYAGQPVVWNACITTTKGDYYDKAQSIALEEGYDKYPLTTEFETYFVKIAGTTHSKMVDPNPELSDTRYSWCATRTMELINSGTVTIKPWDIEIDTTYEYGVGLHIRIDVDSINISDVENFITAFTEKGVEVFFDKPQDEVSYTAQELGVELKDGDRWVTWVDPRFSHDTVAIREDLFNDEDCK